MRLGTFFLGLGLVCLATAVTPPAAMAQLLLPNSEAEDAYEQGMALLEQESYEEALTLFGKAIELNPTYAVAYFGRGEALRELEDYSTALQNYTSALDIDRKMTAAYNGRGVCYRELNQAQIALNDFQTAFELSRRDTDVAANLGEMLVQFGSDPKRAIKILNLAKELDPKNAEVLRNIGWSWAHLKEYDEAISHLQQSIKLDPEEYKTHLSLAQVHLAEEDYQLAIEPLGQAIATYKPEEEGEPKVFINGYLMRADTHGKLGELDETTEVQLLAIYEAMIADCDTVLEEFPDRYPESAIALFRRGLALRMLGRFSEAIKSLTDAAQMIPPGENNSYLAEAYLKRGICWHNQQEQGLARRDFDRASAIDFEDPRAYLWIGITYAQEQDYRRAIEYYSEAISKSQNFTLAHVNKGLAYLQLKEYQKAVDSFNEAIANEPNEAEHYYKRGLTYGLMDESTRTLESALSSFELTILNDPTMTKAYREGAKVLRKLGRSELAEQWETKAQQPEAEALQPESEVL